MIRRRRHVKGLAYREIEDLEMSSRTREL